MKSYILCGLTATVVLVSAGSAKAAVVLQATYGLGESGSYTTGNSNYAPLVDTLNGHNIKTGLNLTNTQGTSAQTATIITTGLSSGATAAGSTAALQISNNAARAGGYYDNTKPFGYTGNFAFEIYARPDYAAGTILLQTDGNPGDPNPSNNGLSLWAQFNGKLVMAHAGNGGTTSPTAGVSYSTGTWYKIDMINTTTAGGATTNSFYVNNVLVASDNIASSLSQPRLGFASGAGNSTNAAYDSMKVWSFDSTDSLSSVTSAIGIPEPTSLAAAFVAGAGVLRRRRHFGA